METLQHEIIDINAGKDETLEQYVLRIGDLKTQGKIKGSWEDVCRFVRAMFPDAPVTESWYRKTYKRLTLERAAADASSEDAAVSERGVINYFKQIENQRIRARDEQLSIARAVRERSRRDEFFDLLETEIQKATPIQHIPVATGVYDKAIYACLSDLHFGLAYESSVGTYNSDIARARVMSYAAEIRKIAEREHCAIAYVSLMGDMISGNIHTTVRIENRENIVEQIVGASELVSEFLRDLASAFDTVFVNSVPGNHSRIDANLDNTLRGERMDSLVTWYCKTKLINISNIRFTQNSFDSTVGTFEIFNRVYACVHGDMDPDIKTSAARISVQLGKPVYCMLSGHMHVASVDYQDTVYIRNGSVCGAGDEYTMKKRLFGPPVQVCAVVSSKGVESVYPVTL